MKYAEYVTRGSFSKEELVAMSWGKLVEDQPYEDFAVLPAPPLLMFDRVTELRREGSRGVIIAEQDVRFDDWFFQCHFRLDPVQPGCLGVDAVWQLLGLYCSACGARGIGRALGCKEVEFSGQIRPHDRVVRYEVEIRRYTELKSSGTAIVIGTGRVFVDDQHIYTITDAKVGLFEGIRYADYPSRSANSSGGVLKR
ncbi:MAG TPA: bifunctional 3-hydroxydecanoyl-ACP dehydratase/trans-2-decenoyl-ACP isomerase [Gemmatimonadaceae bacterium]|jgi:3-hydroxymyristoyl/3-hydroxydecanoyl-(acyl carrier protein) dehydratases